MSLRLIYSAALSTYVLYFCYSYVHFYYSSLPTWIISYLSNNSLFNYSSCLSYSPIFSSSYLILLLFNSSSSFFILSSNYYSFSLICYNLLNKPAIISSFCLICSPIAYFMAFISYL